MTREIIDQESNVQKLDALYYAHRIILEYYEDIYGGPRAAAHFNREYCVMRDSATRIYQRLISLYPYGTNDKGSDAAQDMDRRSEGGIA